MNRLDVAAADADLRADSQTPIDDDIDARDAFAAQRPTAEYILRCRQYAGRRLVDMTDRG
jgi:hypothetical protein